MICAKLYGKNDLRVQEAVMPTISDDEILLKTRAAAICGTDLRMFKNGATGIDEQNPLTITHEFAGTIEQIGKNITGYELGQRVSIAPNIGCGICGYCVAGNSHNCNSLVALGIHIDGGLSEYVKIPANAIKNGNVTPLTDGISFEAAAACEALACVFNSFERYKINPGDVVLIIGAGAIGLMHAKLAFMSGASIVVMNDISLERLELCKEKEPRIITIYENLHAAIDELTNHRGCDVVITSCSAPQAQQIAMDFSAMDGRVNFFGGLPKDREVVSLNTNIIHYKQLSVTGTTRSSLRQYRTAISLVQDGLIDLDSLITHRYPLKDVETALSNAEKGKGLKQVILFE